MYVCMYVCMYACIYVCTWTLTVGTLITFNSNFRLRHLTITSNTFKTNTKLWRPNENQTMSCHQMTKTHLATKWKKYSVSPFNESVLPEDRGRKVHCLLRLSSLHNFLRLFCCRSRCLRPNADGCSVLKTTACLR